MLNMHRWIPVLFIPTLLFAGCAPKSAPPLTDGEFSVAYEEPDATGWTAFLELTVKDGKIAQVNFDYWGSGDAQGTLKSESPAYNEAMAAVTGTKPELYLAMLEEDLLKSQAVDQVDVISGATTSSEDFKTFALLALEASQKGDFRPVVLPQP